MAASGSLQQIFDKPLKTKTSPFNSILSNKPNTNPIKPDHDSCSSFPDMFTNIDKSTTKDYISTKHTNMNAESLFICTEGLGFESFDDVEDLKKEDQDHINDDQSKKQNETKHAVSEMILTSDQPKRSRIKGMEFPPLISSLGSVSGKKPLVCLKSFRSEGRFILKEVLIPNHELLHACREDGRLKLQFVQSDDEASNEEDDHEAIREIDNVTGEMGSNCCVPTDEKPRFCE